MLVRVHLRVMFQSARGPNPAQRSRAVYTGLCVVLEVANLDDDGGWHWLRVVSCEEQAEVFWIAYLHDDEVEVIAP